MRRGRQASKRLARAMASARLPPVDEIRLRFAGTNSADAPLGAGMHTIGRGADGALGLVAGDRNGLLNFCVDRRGVWMTVHEAARGVHVNGRPVKRMAMLRVGDSVYVDGVEMVLVSGQPVATLPAELGNAPVDFATDPRIVLRGVGGRYHGRSFTLEHPRLVGRAADADIRIDDPAFPERHARIDLSGNTILLRDLGSSDGSLVNGQPVRDAVLRPGDQVVFDAHHRFVIEAPARTNLHHESPPPLDDEAEETTQSGLRQHNARRLPWLLLAALMIAGALSALLLFGTST